MNAGVFTQQVIHFTDKNDNPQNLVCLTGINGTGKTTIIELIVNLIKFKTIIKTKDGNEHGLELLSSGEESLLVTAIQIYLRASENTVILIDEIDGSLHPEYQEKIMKILKKLQEKFDCQIIVSSHSRFIWNEVDEKAIIRLTEVLERVLFLRIHVEVNLILLTKTRSEMLLMKQEEKRLFSLKVLQTKGFLILFLKKNV